MYQLRKGTHGSFVNCSRIATKCKWHRAITDAVSGTKLPCLSSSKPRLLNPSQSAQPEPLCNLCNLNKHKQCVISNLTSPFYSTSASSTFHKRKKTELLSTVVGSPRIANCIVMRMNLFQLLCQVLQTPMLFTIHPLTRASTQFK